MEKTFHVWKILSSYFYRNLFYVWSYGVRYKNDTLRRRIYFYKFNEQIQILSTAVTAKYLEINEWNAKLTRENRKHKHHKCRCSKGSFRSELQIRLSIRHKQNIITVSVNWTIFDKARCMLHNFARLTSLSRRKIPEEKLDSEAFECYFLAYSPNGKID